MAETREFHIGHILSVTTGKVVCKTEPPINGIYEILNFMSGESLFTHQLPRVADEARPVLLRQHPALAEVDASQVGEDNWRTWLDAQVGRFGEMLPVEPMTPDEHEHIEPVSELAEKVHPERIVMVKS